MEKNQQRFGMMIRRVTVEEIWEKWGNGYGINSKYYVESLIDNIEGFQIVLSEANNEYKKVEILFEDSVYAYRSTDESFRQSTINKLDELYGIDFYKNNTLFIVTNSKYIRWLSKQSFGIVDLEEVKHYSILAVDSLVDVISSYEPRITKHENVKTTTENRVDQNDGVAVSEN